MVTKETREILKSNHESEICKFYNKKSILITGAAGFLGEVLLEILLRCCPGIARIYILLRPKEGLQPEDRKEKLFKRALFDKLIEKDPDVLDKVIVISGDVSHDNLGMSDNDYLRITEEVSIVFHVAASVSFFRPISFLMNQNVIGTNNVIDLCKKINKLEALVYTSTLYSNLNQENEIKESVYKLPFKTEEAIRLTRNGDLETLNKFYSEWNTKFLNYYAFSKCLSENLLLDNAHNLPVSIIRPSVIISCLKGALPGYVEYGSALVSLATGVGKGFIHVTKAYGKNKFQFIPADIAANTHIVAAFLQATKRMPSPSVYNCTSAVQTHTWEEFARSLVDNTVKYPLPNSYIIPSVTFCSNVWLYKFYSLVYHFIPAMIVDTCLWIAGRKPILFKSYKFLERVSNAAEPLLIREWDFKCENFISLSDKLNGTDAEIFYVDMREFDLETWKSFVYTGSPQYRVNNKLYKDTLKDTLLRYFLTYLIKCLHLGIIVAVCYFVFTFINTEKYRIFPF